jgi:hypothetical protein
MQGTAVRGQFDAGPVQGPRAVRIGRVGGSGRDSMSDGRYCGVVLYLCRSGESESAGRSAALVLEPYQTNL